MFMCAQGPTPHVVCGQETLQMHGFPIQTYLNGTWVIPYQFTEVSHMTLSDLDEIQFVGSPSGHM